jgi:hypothetical protein
MAYKMIAMLRKRADLSVDAFRRLYEDEENGHARLGRKVLEGRAIKYVRRYLDPIPAGETERDYHVLTEVWYADRAACEAAMAHMADPAVAREIAEDEDRLFDRASMRFYCIDEERETAEIAATA